ncbi:murein hydrolase activator EnvC family protein [Microbacterium sp. NPDC056569]|uniref:murein hydrolase activator EnvC family protein n=1 Tax=Microbacterium sp. NPDC056569 TaxID=3345867 RepID=UPI00366EBCF7
MPTSAPSLRRRSPDRISALVIAVCLLADPSPAGALASDAGDPAPPAGSGAVSLVRDWRWPVHPFRLVRPFVAPAHEYGPGHRGVDLMPMGDGVVQAPAAGVVAFSGQVAGRGVITVDHGDGLVSTLEPVDAVVAAGTPVDAAATLGTVAAGGHSAPGAVHFGVRLDGAYINPLVLLGGVPRAVLLPCC